jgi:hypothetical protein
MSEALARIEINLSLILIANEGLHELQEEPLPLYAKFEHRRGLGSSPR